MITKQIRTLLCLSIAAETLTGCSSAASAASASASVQSAAQIVAPVSEDGAVAGAYTDEATRIVETVEGSTLQTDEMLLHIGDALPDMEFTDYDGKTVNLKDYQGKNVVVEVVAYWCEYCQKMTKENFVQEVSDHPDMTFIQMFFNGSKEQIDQFYQDAGISMQSGVTVIPESTQVQIYANTVGLVQLPTFIFYDSTGKVSWLHGGIMKETLLESILPYAFTGTQRLYDMRKENENPADYYRTYVQVRADLDDAAEKQIDAQDSTGKYQKLLYEIISRDVRVSGQVTDSISQTIDYDQTAGKILMYQFWRAGNADDKQQALIKASNAWISSHPEIEVINVIVPGTIEESAWYNAQTEKPTGYVFYQSEKTYPQQVFFAALNVTPSQVFVNGDTGRAMGLSFASTEDQLSAAYALYCGSEPAYMQTRSSAKTVDPTAK